MCVWPLRPTVPIIHMKKIPAMLMQHQHSLIDQSNIWQINSFKRYIFLSKLGEKISRSRRVRLKKTKLYTPWKPRQWDTIFFLESIKYVIFISFIVNIRGHLHGMKWGFINPWKPYNIKLHFAKPIMNKLAFTTSLIRKTVMAERTLKGQELSYMNPGPDLFSPIWF